MSEHININLDVFNGKCVLINIKGAITIPYWIDCFKFGNCREYIAFGEANAEEYAFNIDKYMITDMQILENECDTIHMLMEIGTIELEFLYEG
jgi:hypothetical protein